MLRRVLRGRILDVRAMSVNREQAGGAAPPKVTEASQKNTLSRELRTELWLALANRLRSGEPLCSNGQFLEVLLEIYEQVTGQAPSESVRDEISVMVEAVNRQYPETYLVHGVKNTISRAFEEGVRRKNWDLATVQAKGARTLRRFSQQDSVRDLLEDANLSSAQISVVDCVQQVIDRLAPGQGSQARQPPAAAPVPAFRPDLTPAPVAPGAQSGPPVDADTQSAIDSGDVDGGEARDRHRQGEERRQQLEQQEYAKVSDRLDAFVECGIVTREEAGKLRQLQEVDARLKRGEIDEGEATSIRNSILSGTARDKLERKVHEAVADSVRYLQVFEAMKKIDPKFHDALSFLVQHKNLVAATDGADVDLGPAVKGLMEDVDLLDDIIDIMERKDQELRMMSVRLHPYNGILKRGIERIGNMTIEEDFVNDLESLDLEAMSQRLNSPLQALRVRPAADMRCLISLIDHVTKRTRFRKELRLLRISKTLEEFYQGTSDLKEARHQAESFLQRRLRRLFPDMSTQEASELKQRSMQMMDQIENRILEERQAEVEARRGKTAVAATPGPASGDGEEEMELSEEEVQKGVQIGRVEMRVAGTMRRIPTKIMPDPDDPEVMVLAIRDPATGEVVPAQRRGSKRAVERNRDGYWQESR